MGHRCLHGSRLDQLLRRGEGGSRGASEQASGNEEVSSSCHQPQVLLQSQSSDKAFLEGSHHEAGEQGREGAVTELKELTKEGTMTRDRRIVPC